MKKWRNPKARIVLEQRDDGWLIVYSDDVPMRGLLIAGPDREWVMSRVLPMVEAFQTFYSLEESVGNPARR